MLKISSDSSARKRAAYVSPCIGSGISLLLGSLLFLSSLGSTVSAQSTFYWDADGTGTVDGGTGTWDTTLTNWSTDATTFTGTAWNNDGSGQAIFQGTAGTVTLGSDINLASLTFGTTGYTIDGSSSLDFKFGNAINTGSGDQTIAVDIVGSSITKSGSGTLTLSGTNTYSGPFATTVKDGTLILASGGSNSHSTSATVIGFSDGDVGALLISGGTLDNRQGIIGYDAGSSGSVTVDSGTWNSESISLGSSGTGSLTINDGLVTSSDGSSIGDSASGNGSATVNGGTWNTSSLSVGNQGTGSLTINDGLVTSSGGSSIASSASGNGSATVNGGTWNTSYLSVGKQGTGSLLIDGGLVTSSSLGEIGGSSGSNGSVTVTDGTWAITNSLFVGGDGTGSLLVNGGTVTNGDAYVGFSGSNGTATVTSGTWTNSRSLQIGGESTGSVVVSGGLLSVGDGTEFEYLSIGGSGSGGAGSGAGSLSVSGGEVRVYGRTLIGVGSQVSGNSLTLSGTDGIRGTLSTDQIDFYNGQVIFDGGILKARVDQGNFITTGGNVMINAGGAFIDSNGYDIQIASSIGGTGGLTKLGAGTLTLTNTPFWNSDNTTVEFTYTGGNTVEAGTLLRGTSAAFSNDTPYTVNGGILDLNNFDLTASSLSGTGGSVDLGTADLIVDQSSDTSFSGAIIGTGSLTKQGSGTLALSGTNTHSGGTTISDGTLQITASTIPGNITNNAALIFDQATSETYNGIVSGSGSVAKQGLGNLTFGTAHTYTGGTTVNAGTLTLGSGGSISHSSAATIVGDVDGDLGTLLISGGTLSNSDAIIGNAAGSQGSATVTSGTWTNASTLTVGNSGTGSLSVSGGTVNVDGPLTTGLNGGSTGSLTLTGGTLSTNQIAEGSGTGTVTFDGGILEARVDESDFISAFESGDVTINSGGAFIDSNGHTIGISSIIDGTGTLTKQGSGTLTLSGTNTYTGGTTINRGLIQFTTASNLSTNAVTLNGGGLQWASGSTVDISNQLNPLGSSGGTFDTNSNNVTLATAISGTGRLTKQGSGTLTLSGANTYTGGTTVNSGTLTQGASGAFASDTAYTVNTGGTLDLNDFGLTAASLSGTGGSVDLGTANLTIDQSGTTSYAGAIIGTGSLIKTGSGITTLSGSNTYTGGTEVDSGTLTLGDGGSISHAAADTTLGNSSADVGTLELNSGSSLNTSNLLIGNSGTGNLLITGGTHNSNTATIAFNASSSGSVSVSGGSWTNASSLRVGRASSASLAVSNGGLVTIEGNTYTGYYGGGTGTIILSGTSGNRGTLATNRIDERIGGSGGTVTFDGGILQARIDESTFIANYEAGNVTINAGGAFIDSNGHAIGFASPLGGIGGLTKLGEGTLTLSGTNTYTGGTTVEEGTLLLGASGTTASNTAYIVNDGTLDLNDFDLTASSLSGSGGTLDMGTAALTVDQSDNTTFAGAINGTGSLTKQGVGTLTLSGSNTYTGGTTISEGLLGFTNGDNFGTAGISLNGGGLQWASGSTFDISNRLNAFGASGATFDTNGNNVTLATAMSGTGGITKDGAGTLTLSSDNTYAGGTTANGGLINFASGNNLGTGAITLDGGGLQWATGNTLDISNRLNAIGAAGATFDTNGNDVTFASTMSGTGGITKDGAGTLTLSGAHTYTGGTTVNSGNLTQGASGAFASNHAYTVNGGTLDLNDFNLTAASISGAGGINLGTASLIVNQSSDTNFAGAIIGTGDLTKQGTGTLTLSGNNTYSGGTTISTGTLQGSTASLTGNIINNATLVFDQATSGTFSGDITGSGSVNKQGTGTLTLSGNNAYSGGTTISTGTLQASSASLSGNITNSAALVFDQATTGTFSGDISGSGSITKQGIGTLTLSGDNAYTGDITIENGTLAQGSSTAFTQGTTYTVNGGTLDLNDFDLTILGLEGTGGSIDLGTATLTTLLDRAVRSGTYAGDIHGTGGLINTGGIRSLMTLSGANTYTGGTTVSGGTLTQGASGAFVHNTAYTVNGGTLDLNDFNLTGSSLSGTGGTVELGTAKFTLAQSGDSSYSGAITGTGGLEKQGAGTLILTGNNTYTGGTLVSAGELVVDGTTSASDFTVDGGTLSGSGTVGELIISNGGTLATGNSPGTLNAGNTTFESGGTFEFEINDATGSAGTNWDLLNVSGGLTITATDANPFSINLVSLTASDAAGLAQNFDADADNSWVFVTTTTGINFDGVSIASYFVINTSGFQNTFNGTFGITQIGNTLNLTYTVLPEPSAYTLLFGLFAIGLVVNRRKRN